MKTNNRILIVMVCLLLLFTAPVLSQDEQERPTYVVVTTMHWNLDYEDFDKAKWIATEKEFFDKVIKKNDHIVSAGIYTHLLSDDNSELLYVQVYNTWNDIDLAAKKNQELAESAWPDESKREAFFNKQNAYYAPMHSDEIYATMDHAKLFQGDFNDDMVVYVRKNHFDFPEDGSIEEFNSMNTEFIKNVIHKNEYIKGYYPHSHAYGANSTDFIEGFYLNSMSDLEKMFERNQELIEAHWSSEAKQKEFAKVASKYFTGKHSDAVYAVIPELRK
ncbi:hypothetical protein [Mangrovimonas spongiae]|uniref:NIPSNAP family containing protein n=1 Tax=Mangrovimonas spongiae TaxID=2494697 RepID=A0A428K6H5_9FLAO|nr:hypothetical protein [Mangrovimonas spongiae]RSK41880.1 hypothetical protein EJA19_03095 [Mangrovimonas spongiae]